MDLGVLAILDSIGLRCGLSLHVFRFGVITSIDFGDIGLLLVQGLIDARFPSAGAEE